MKVLVKLVEELKLVETPVALVDDIETRLMVNLLPVVLLSVRLPVTSSRSQPVPAVEFQSHISNSKDPPPLRTVLPALNVPILLPGASRPLTVKAPTLPVPPSEPLLPTATALLVFVPLATKRPALTVVAPL